MRASTRYEPGGSLQVEHEIEPVGQHAAGQDVVYATGSIGELYQSPSVRSQEHSGHTRQGTEIFTVNGVLHSNNSG